MTGCSAAFAEESRNIVAMACGSGILAYMLAAVIIPRRSAIEKAEDPQQ